MPPDNHADRIRAAAAELWRASQMSEDDAVRRAELAASANYWRELAPDLTIGADAGAIDAAGAADAGRATTHFQDDGYFQLPPFLPAGTLASLNRAVDVVTAAGWPAVFAWIYDGPWICSRLPAIRRIVESSLGAGYLQLPHVWVHVVPSVDGASGWRPHFDGPESDRVSVWVALTDATTENGCMHVVPRRALPSAFRGDWHAGKTVSVLDAARALHASRPLPTLAGGAIGWTFDVLHWGGSCVTTGGSRRALSMEFVQAAESARDANENVLAIDGSLPTFEQRVDMIAEAIATYELFEPVVSRHRPVADELRARHHS